MKTIALLVSTWISAIAANIFGIWAIVEFILYLVKDKYFNWLSVWLFGISVVLIIVFMVLSLIVNGKARTSNFNLTKSKFQQRIEEMNVTTIKRC